LVKAGARVYVASRKVPDSAVSDLNSAGASAGGKAFAISADLSKLDGVDKVVQTIKEKEGKLHVLVNNGE
jgi:NAD(P)-dependent dehydrogenase (short-subunit alcohol dehydrogenase family)